MTASEVPTTEEIADGLEKAADLIESVGFCQKKARATKDGEVIGYCVMGALHEAFGLYEANLKTVPSKWRHRMIGRTYAIDQVTGRIHTQIPIWNDAPGRTPEDAISLLKYTAKDLRNKEGSNV